MGLLVTLTAFMVHGATGASAETFVNFTVVNTAAEIKAALEADAGGKVWIKRGVYHLACPIVIDATAPLLVYGEGVQTSLRCAVPSASVPMIHIDSSSTVRFAWLQLAPDANNPTTNVDAIAKPASGRLELADAALGGRIHITGAGVFHWENVRAGGGGRVDATVLVDNAQADVIMVQGDLSNGCALKQIAGEHQYHVWIKNGRLRIVGLSMEATLGRADIRIDGASPLGPHYIVGIRSEGASGSNGPNTTCEGGPSGDSFPSTLVYVPRRSGAVHLVVMGFTAAWGTSLPAGDSVVDYGGSGTVWALGNVCDDPGECHSLITGQLSAATLVAVGNFIWAEDGALASTVIPANVGTLYRAHNRYRDHDGPLYTVPLELTNDVATFPNPPLERSPHSLVHPTMTALAAAQLIANGSSLINVKAAPYFAAGNGVTDDTAELQAALDSGCIASSNNAMPVLFFPSGTYRVSSTLRLNVEGGACYALYVPQQAGAILVGEGASSSKIQLNAETTLFESHGMRQSYFGDLQFQTAPGTKTSGSYAAVAIDYDYSGPSDDTSSRVATAGVHFHRVEASGGRRAIVMGHTSEGSQASENLCTYCTLRNAGVGWSSGHANALNNYLYDSSAVNVDYVLGPLDGDQGSVGGVHVTQSGIRGSTWSYTGTSYANVMSDLSGASPQYFLASDGGPMTNPVHILHDSSPTVSAAVPNQWFRTHRTGNLLLVGSTVTGGDVVLAPCYQLWRYAVFVGSNFSRYDQITIAGLEDKSKSNPPPKPPGGGCGLGFEIALPLTILAWRRRGRSEDVAPLASSG